MTIKTEWINWFNQKENRKVFNKEIGRNINYRLINTSWNNFKTFLAILGIVFLIAIFLIVFSSYALGFPVDLQDGSFFTIRHIIDNETLYNIKNIIVQTIQELR